MSNENNCDIKTKDIKCVLNKKFFSPTIRLSVSLREPDEENCSVFDYISLITEEKRIRRRKKEQYALNNSLEDSKDDDDDIKKLAQHFEEKYGGTTKKKKKRKAPTFYNYTELASGYDENDSFIDNSEAFDEALPDEMETFHGGYYVNCGELEFKKIELVEENSDLEEVRIAKKKNSVIQSDISDSEADSIRSDIDKSECVEEDVDYIKLPNETNHQEIEIVKNENVNAVKPIEKSKTEKCKEFTVNNSTKLVNGEIKKRNKYKKRRLSEEKETEIPKPKKKTITVKTLLEEKRIVESSDNSSVKSSDIIRNSINDVIESVVNAARYGSEDSRDSITSGSSETKSLDSRTSYETEKDSHVEEMETVESSGTVSHVSSAPKEECKLPDNLSSDVLELINQIKDNAKNSESGVRTFFDSYINSKLLNLEIKVRPLMPTVRHYIYAHLASFLPCSKDTLMKRAKKQLIEQEEKCMVEPFKKLKASIEKIMPSLMDSYTVSCQQIADEKNINDFNKNGDIDDKKILLNKMPQKKFLWTDEIRGYLRELVACRLNCFHMLKPRKESSDEYVKKFLETKVKPLWPQGWMDTAILWKEANSNNITSKNKKSSVAVNSNSSNNNNVNNSTKKPHSSVPNSNLSVSSSCTNMNTANSFSSFLTNALALQSLATQYSSPSSDAYPVISSTATTVAPYHTDLNSINAAAASLPSSKNSNLLLSMDLLSRFNTMTTKKQYSTKQPYSKSTSPPKKAVSVAGGSYSSSLSSSQQRSTTPVSLSAIVTTAAAAVTTVTQSHVNSLEQHKKSTDKSSSSSNDTMASKLKSNNNNLFKIDSLINTSKTKKEHHMLNHVSQYNKHYSHKKEKRKNHSEKKDNSNNNNNNNNSGSMNSKQSNSQNISTSNNSSSGNNNVTINVSITQDKVGNCDQVLDLSPNKVKIEVKSDTINKINENKFSTSPKDANNYSITAASNITAKDHNYWSSSGRKKDVSEIKEERKQNTPPLTQRTTDTPNNINQNTICKSSSTNQTVSFKPTHLSRKQRILQESAKSVVAAHDIVRSLASDGAKTVSQTTQNLLKPLESTYPIKNESQNVTSSIKKYEKMFSPIEEKPFLSSSVSLHEEKQLIEETATATDILSKIINDSLQENSSPLQLPFPNSSIENKIKTEIKLEDVETKIEVKPIISQKNILFTDKVIVNSISPEGKTQNNDQAELEAAEVIKDLQVLNQIGGNSVQRRIDYQDPSYADRHDLNYSNNSSTLAKSSRSSSENKSSIPRMSLSGFQDEFFKHIFRSSSPSCASTQSQDSFNGSEHRYENNKSPVINHTVSPSSTNSGNTNLFNYQQSVIMQPGTLKWHTPVSKS